MLEKIIFTLLAAVVAFIAYGIFVFIPVDIYTEAECLKKGYPSHRVSIGLERYCTTLEGAVAPKVEKL